MRSMGTPLMKIVLVNPPSPPEFRVSRGLMGGFGMAVNPDLLYPPIELAHVASVLEADGHQVAIFDADTIGLRCCIGRCGIVQRAYCRSLVRQRGGGWPLRIKGIRAHRHLQRRRDGYLSGLVW